MYKFTKWTEPTFSLIVLVFGCEVEKVIQNNLTINEFIFYATLVVLPAKEVIQSFTAAIKQKPNVAYGRANELTPVGRYWDELFNDKTAKLPLEHFLYPYLVYIYARTELNYKAGAKFKKNAVFLFVAAYYLVLLNLVAELSNKPIESPDDVEIEVYRNVFKAQTVNTKLLSITDGILKEYFKDSAIQKAVDNDLRGFLQNKVHSRSNWAILEEKVKQEIQDLIDDENGFISDLKSLAFSD